MQRGGYVYLMASPNKVSVYVGMTSDLCRRVYQHRNKHYSGSFTARYNCVMLVYYCGFNRIEEAIAEEKRVKAGSRVAKDELIGKMNPEWLDLWADVQHW